MFNTLKSGRRLLRASAAGAALLAFSAPVAAMAQEQTFRFNIPAQSLGPALRAFGQASNQQIIFSETQVRGRAAPAVVGTMSARAALERMLAGSGLAAERTSAGVLVLRGGGSGAPTSGSGQGAQAEPVKVEELVVTGSRLQGGTDAARPVNVYTAEAIARTGQVRLETFLNSLPEVSVNAAGNAYTRYGSQAGVRLRGLPDGSTAVLLDGRRAGTSGLNVVSYFDINTIPLGLIDRVDIVPIGSSAVYGSDAIGGVLNIVLKKHIDGLQVNGDYSFADHHEERGASLVWGRTFERGSVVLGAAYHEQDGINAFERSITASSDYRQYAALGGTDWRLPYCEPGNVQAVQGTLNGLGTKTAAIPATGSNVVANYTAGAQNTCSSYLASTPIVTPSLRLSIYGSGEYQLGGGVVAYASVLASRVRNDGRSLGSAVDSQLVPASNPYNPFHQDVLVTTVLPYEAGTILKTTVVRPLVGLRGDLPRGWDWDVSAWASLMHEDADDGISGGSPLNLTRVVSRTDPATAFNLFAPSSNSPALLAEVMSRGKNVAHAEQDVMLGVIRGDLFSLPAGPVRTASGVELRYDDYWKRSYSGVQLAFSKGGRRAQAAFTEVAIPLVGGAEEGEPARLEASAAARYDHYSDFGGKVSPQLGLQARFWDGLGLGATTSRSFKAPGLGWLHQAIITTPNGGTLVDPRRGEAYRMTLIIGGNPNLQPEMGKANSVTLSWDSRRLEGLHLSTTYFQIGMDNRTSALGYQNIINNEALFPDRVVRQPSSGTVPGRIISVNNTYTNFGSIRVRGIDLHARYDLRTDYGIFTPSVALTRMLEYRSQLQPNQPFVDRLSKASSSDAWSPKLKATAGVTWMSGETQATVQGRYIGSYLDYQNSPPNTNRLGRDWFLDGSLQIPLNVLTRRVAEDAYFRISGTNLLNRLPRYSNYNSGLVGYDPYESDFIGRAVTIGVGGRF